MGSLVFPPSIHLQEYVLYYVLIDFSFDTATTTDIYPNGLCGLAFSFGDAYKYANRLGEETNLNVGGCVLGPHESIFKTVSKRQKQFIIFFKPGVLGKIIQMPMFEFRNKVVKLEDFIKNENEICEFLSLAKKKIEQITIVEDRLKKSISSKKIYKDLTGSLVTEIITKSGNIRINDLCKNHKLNKKYIERKFQENLGISPKRYSEIIKLNTILNVISTDNTKWSQIGIDTGFNDHSHLSKYIHKFTNLSPKNIQEKIINSSHTLHGTDTAFASLCIQNT